MPKQENPRCRIVFQNKAGEVSRVMDPRTGEDVIPVAGRASGEIVKQGPKPEPVPMHTIPGPYEKRR